MLKIANIGPGQPVHHMRIFHRFCWSQVKAGHEVVLIAHDDGQTHDFPIQIVDLGSRRSAGLRWNLWSRLKRNAKAYALAVDTRADIYVFYSPEFIPFALLLKWVTGKPVVFDCMEDFVSYARQHRGIPPRLQNFVATIVDHILQFAARQLDFVSVADEGTNRQFRQSTVNVVTLFNFPRLDLFPSRLSDKRTPYEFDLVYHGTNHRHYLTVLLQIDHELLNLGKAVQWYLFGTFAELGWLQAELKLRHAEHRFYIGGLVPHDQVFTEVQRARIGIIPLPALPKYFNNIPQKLFEFMALGMPVILSDLPPSRPFVEESGAGVLIDPNDFAAYARAIARLLNDAELCQTMGQRGRYFVEKKFNWDSEAKKLQGLIDALKDQPIKTEQIIPVSKN